MCFYIRWFNLFTIVMNAYVQKIFICVRHYIKGRIFIHIENNFKSFKYNKLLLYTNSFVILFILMVKRYDWCNNSGCVRLRKQIVAFLNVLKRVLRLVLRLEIIAFAGYLWLVIYQMQQLLNNKLTIFIFYITIKSLKIIIL